MRRLLLLSRGIKGFEKTIEELCNKPLHNIDLAYISTARKPQPLEDQKDMYDDFSYMKELGIHYEDIDIEGKTEKQLRNLLYKKDAILVSGGDGFYLLKHARISGFDKVVSDFINEGIPYIGYSSGAYLLCPTLEMHNLRNRKDTYGLTDLKALNLVPFLLVVHFKEEKRSLLEEFASKAEYPLRVLKDKQGFLVIDDKVTFIGEGTEIKLNNVK
jgi:dipeptidase E